MFFYYCSGETDLDYKGSVIYQTLIKAISESNGGRIGYFLLPCKKKIVAVIINRNIPFFTLSC